MRRALTALLIAAASTSLAAQTATSAAKPSAQAKSDGSTVTVTGCLAKGDAANTFVLTSVKWDTAASSGQAGHHEHQQPPPTPSTAPPMTTPTTPSTAPAESAAKKTADEALQRAGQSPRDDKLRLAGNTAQLKLADHIGHTITATGMLATADPVVTPGVVLPDPPSGSKPASKPSSELRVLNVRSITPVSGECK